MLRNFLIGLTLVLAFGARGAWADMVQLHWSSGNFGPGFYSGPFAAKGNTDLFVTFDGNVGCQLHGGTTTPVASATVPVIAELFVGGSYVWGYGGLAYVSIGLDQPFYNIASDLYMSNGNYASVPANEFGGEYWGPQASGPALGNVSDYVGPAAPFQHYFNSGTFGEVGYPINYDAYFDVGGNESSFHTLTVAFQNVPEPLPGATLAVGTIFFLNRRRQTAALVAGVRQ